MIKNKKQIPKIIQQQFKYQKILSDFLQIKQTEMYTEQGQKQRTQSLSGQSDQVQQLTKSNQSQQQDQKNQLEFEQQFRFEKKQKKYQEMTFLMGCLKNHFVFYNLNEAELQNIAKKMFYCTVPTDNYIFVEGSKALCFFIIQKGLMQVISNGKMKKQLRVGDGFGQIALLYKSPRGFSVKATQNCCLWGIDRNTFRKAVQEVIILQFEQNKKFMENIRFFSCLSNQHKDTVAGALVTQQFNKGQVIVAEGDPGSSFYIIKQGSASVWKGNKFLMKLQKSDSFGQQALFYNTVRQMTVRADEDLTCLILGRDTLSKVLGDQIFIVTFRNFMKWSIQKSNNLSKLNKQQIDRILDLIKINSYKVGSVVIKKNTENFSNQKIIIVIQGSLKKAKNMNSIAVRSQIYGQEYLIQSKVKNRYQDDIVMESDGVLGQIKVEVVKQIIGGYLDVIIEKNQKQTAENLQQEMAKRNTMINSLDQLSVIKQLCENEFGPIVLVGNSRKCQKQPHLYLLKCYSKLRIEERSLYQYITQQKNVLQSLYHPFIMQYYKSFKDQHYLYSLVQFIQGQQLYSAIRQIGLLSTQDAQFYIASMILIIEYLCGQGLIIRDVKPENFIVDTSGYIKLIDLVSAKLIKGKNIMTTKTFTLIGTPHYMAPQIIIGKGYTFSIALYSLGINLYEFMCGYVPFGEQSQDPLDIYEEILNVEVKFPKSLKDKKAKKLIEQLLNKADPQSRLGGPNFNSLKNNPWFQGIDWAQLYQKNIDPPKFQRNLNVQGDTPQLLKFIRHARNCIQYLDQRLPLRNVGEGKTFGNW